MIFHQMIRLLREIMTSCLLKKEPNFIEGKKGIEELTEKLPEEW